MTYQNTALWKASLADHKDGHDDQRKDLRDAFEVARKKKSWIRLGQTFPH